MTKTKKKNTPPVYNPVRASKRFIRNLIWACLICGGVLAGQGVRYYLNYDQLETIRAETKKLYVSVLGEDIGNSPFGRLQFEQGKLTASKRVGLDPLKLLASLSLPEVEGLRVEEIALKGVTGTISGVMEGGKAPFDAYFNALSDDDNYIYRLNKSEEIAEGVRFSLIVEVR